MNVEGVRHVAARRIAGAMGSLEPSGSGEAFSRELDNVLRSTVKESEWLDPTKLGTMLSMLDLDPMTLERVLEQASKIQSAEGFRSVALRVDGKVLAPEGEFNVVVEARRLEVLRERVAQAEGKDEASRLVKDYAQRFGLDLSESQVSELVDDILASMNYDEVVGDWAKLYLEVRKNDMERAGMMAFGRREQQQQAGLPAPTGEDQRILERDGQVARWDELRRVDRFQCYPSTD